MIRRSADDALEALKVADEASELCKSAWDAVARLGDEDDLDLGALRGFAEEYRDVCAEMAEQAVIWQGAVEEILMDQAASFEVALRRAKRKYRREHRARGTSARR